MHTFIQSLRDHVGQPVVLKGWASNTRSSGSLVFIELRDGTGFAQVVVAKDAVPVSCWEVAQRVGLEYSLTVAGVVTEHPHRPGEYEIQTTDIDIISGAEEYPIGKKEHGPDFLLDHRHLWLRSSKQWAIQRVRNTIINATYAYFNSQSYIKIDAPVLTPTSCEDTTELFGVDYFDEGKAYLSQSGQLYIEAAIFAHGRVFDFGPVFRAEKSKTRRHLTEFWMMDAEAAFVDHAGNMAVQEGLICAIVEAVLARNMPELAILERDVAPLQKVQAPFVRMTHAQAVQELRGMGSDIGDMDDLGADDETMLTQKYDKPIFVEQYPAAVKAFYMKRNSADPTRVLNADLLAPEGYGEIIGGSEREADYDTLVARLREFNLPQEPFAWYLDLRKYGSVPHSGFGYGLERIVAWVCGLKHIRESIPFPRMINRLNP